VNISPEPPVPADVPARRRGGRPSLDPARRRACPLTVNVDEATARRAWAAAADHPHGVSGLLRDALAAALDAADKVTR
jgi:hypothetical protein